MLLGVNVQLAQHSTKKAKAKGRVEGKGKEGVRPGRKESARSSLRLSGRQVDWAREGSEMPKFISLMVQNRK